MKILTYNVNGIRSAMSKGWLEWLQTQNPDVVCLQEIKAQTDQLNLSVFNDLGYNSYWYSAEKKGYSGVAILTKQKPLHVEYGCAHPLYDYEGRTLRVDFQDVSVMSLYAPSGTTGDIRQQFKFEWMDFFFNYAKGLKEMTSNLLICGDFNICHRPIDIHNPVSNAKSSGFLPEERAWMEKMLTEGGYIDTFRQFNSNPHQYTWWSFRAGSRQKNLGWRIDYILANEAMQSRLSTCKIIPDAFHSDHCPVELAIDV
jgi:exodeoxyribonuclease-3